MSLHRPTHTPQIFEVQHWSAVPLLSSEIIRNSASQTDPPTQMCVKPSQATSARPSPTFRNRPSNSWSAKTIIVKTMEDQPLWRLIELRKVARVRKAKERATTVGGVVFDFFLVEDEVEDEKAKAEAKENLRARTNASLVKARKEKERTTRAKVAKEIMDLRQLSPLVFKMSPATSPTNAGRSSCQPTSPATADSGADYHKVDLSCM